MFFVKRELSSNEFDHILPACKDKVDAVIFSFSFANEVIFENMRQQMARVAGDDDSR